MTSHKVKADSLHLNHDEGSSIHDWKPSSHNFQQLLDCTSVSLQKKVILPGTQVLLVISKRDL